MLIACIFSGWKPGVLNIASVVAGMLIVMLLSYGLGLIFGVANVFFRDSENLVDMFLMVATWLSPVLYSWALVRDTLYPWVFNLFMMNPLTVAVELFHYAFWHPTLTDHDKLAPTSQVVPHLFSFWTPVAIGVSLLTVLIGDFLFRKFEGNFAQEL